MLIYRILSVALYPFLELYLFWRVYKKKEDKKRLKERFGHATIFRPKTSIIWIHAVSVGETNSALILVDELLKTFPTTSILFTTTTITSASVVAAKLPAFEGRVVHQFLPIDTYFCVKNFFEFWRPEIAIFVESEIWPNLVGVADEMGVPTFLVNARMSEKSATKWTFAKYFGIRIFDYFSGIFAQSEEDKTRFQKLTDKEVFFFGNLKSQAQSLEFNDDELVALKSKIAGRKFWLAASTHQGEEEAIVQAHQILKKDFPDLLTILALRHPNRADEVKPLFGSMHFAQRSRGEKIENDTQIYLVDTLGELGLFYRLANFALIGGSLAKVGGHNPFEAIKLECGVISGRNVKNFKSIYESLEAKNACVMVDSSAMLAAQVKEFFQNEKALQVLNKNAAEAILVSENIAGEVVEKISFILEL
ncbi:MAG: 3-deoxy-D-manno-octulosonic acid transferase [Rickettsiales bacterium]|nr:3-deoxy-D-manno-octulosonic acid transferase [Rickettsiales bacterium]